ncbi:MAG: DUF2203 domain-containing protein [Acidimicrobiales bacterium]
MAEPVEPKRWWTVEEANAALPHVTEVVERAREAAQGMQERAQRLTAVARRNGHGPPQDEAAIFNEAVRDLAKDGIVLRDVEQGLIDFPAQAPSGRAYWLCWLVGEPEVAWWHWPEDGFPGRTPLDQPPG